MEYLKPEIEVTIFTSNAILCASVSNDNYNESEFNWW